jgi:Raf kinase inhibitor-like YbhB/YbcL family protein
MNISSPAFKHGGTIPDRYSREGGNDRPTLLFEHVPAEAKSLVVIVDDPDAPNGTFTHWLAYNISPATREISDDTSPSEFQQAQNDSGHAEYSGPRPPSGEHRYFFKLYALDDRITLLRGASRLDLEEAILGHIIAEAEYMGRFAAHSLVEAA